MLVGFQENYSLRLIKQKQVLHDDQKIQPRKFKFSGNFLKIFVPKTAACCKKNEVVIYWWEFSANLLSVPIINNHAIFITSTHITTIIYTLSSSYIFILKTRKPPRHFWYFHPRFLHFNKRHMRFPPPLLHGNLHNERDMELSNLEKTFTPRIKQLTIKYFHKKASQTYGSMDR